MERLRRLLPYLRDFGRGVVRHALSVYAAAIAFHLLVAFVPLVLLAVALLGAFGLPDVWTDTMAPALQDRLNRPVFAAIDYSVDKIFASSKVGLITLSCLLLVWMLSRAVAATSVALNTIHNVEDEPPWSRRLAITVGLAISTALCLIAAFLALAVVPRLAQGALHVLLVLAGIVVAAFLLGVAVALLVRYAPAEHPEPRWASAGSAFIVAGWLVESLLYGWWAGSVASYKSAVGNLAVFLVLAAYVLVASAIFLAGVELDELARKSVKGGGRRRSGR